MFKKEQIDPYKDKFKTIFKDSLMILIEFCIKEVIGDHGGIKQLKICHVCSNTFSSKSVRAIYCSSTCRATRAMRTYRKNKNIKKAQSEILNESI